SYVYVVLLPTFITFLFTHASHTHIYTLSLHDALPISHYSRSLETLGWEQGETHASYIFCGRSSIHCGRGSCGASSTIDLAARRIDRKSTRLNSSHVSISYAVFCLKKKTNKFNISLISA